MLPLLLAVEVLPVAAPLELELVVDPEVLLVLEVLDVALDAAVEVLEVEEEVVPAIQRVWSMVPSWICGLLMAAWAAYSR